MVGNLTVSGVPVPFDTLRGFSEPNLDLSTVQDDYGRTYAGNPLKQENQLFTQCWNDTLVGQASVATQWPCLVGKCAYAYILTVYV